MYLRINSHSGSVKDPAPSPGDPPVITGGYAGCPCKLNNAIPNHSRREQPHRVPLNEGSRLTRISDSNRNSWMHFDPHINQPGECRTSPFTKFILSTLFSIDLFDANERKHSPPCEPNANKPFLHDHGHPSTHTDFGT